MLGKMFAKKMVGIMRTFLRKVVARVSGCEGSWLMRNLAAKECGC